MEIRPATRADIDTVVDLWVDLASGQRSHGSHLLAQANRGPIREVVAQRVVAEHVLLAVADTSAEVLGFVMIAMDRGRYEQDVVQGVVENLFVRPEARDEGVGSALLTAAEDALTGKGAETVTLEVMAENEAARRFYRRHGYAPHRLELEKTAENDTL